MAQRPVYHLEELLTNWEDWSLMQHAAIADHLASNLRPPAPMIGAYKNWSRFRQTVLERKVFEEQIYGLNVEMLKHTQLFGSIPFFVWAWSYWSRRVFSMSRDLQAVLSATTTRGITYSDLALPFQAFMLELAKPILNFEGMEYDAILVVSGSPSRPLETENNRLAFIPLLKDRGDGMALPRDMRDKLKTFLAKKRWDKVEKLHAKMRDHIKPSILGGLVIDLRKQGNLPVTMPIAKIFEHCSCGQRHETHDQMHEQMVRLVVGFCLYLQTLSSKASRPSTWTALDHESSRFYASSVTNGAQICEVGHEIKLSPADLSILESQFISDEHAGDADSHRMELKFHFRIGHWRRPPGKGHDPTQPKIVLVRPTVVRREKFEEGLVPEAVRVNVG